MKRLRLILPFFMLCLFGSAVFAGDVSYREQRKQFHKAYTSGNYADAYKGFCKLALDPEDDPALAGNDMGMAIACLGQLNRRDEIDEFRENVIKAHADNRRLLFAAASSLMNGEHYGYIVAGKFYRGRHRGGGSYVNSRARDRIRSLQLMTIAMEKSKGEKRLRDLSGFYLEFARMVRNYRSYHEAWRLQYLSNLSILPDYEERYYYGRRNISAPVHPDGTPVFYKIPRSYENARNDGERWRWLLMQGVECNPQAVNEARMRLADFLKEQFGVQTMAYYGRYFRPFPAAEDKKTKSGIYTLHTLGENETMAKLATGIKRFTLPDEFNFIKIYRKIADSEKSWRARRAIEALAGIFENRRQYDRAGKFWKRDIEEYGKKDYKQSHLRQIYGNWGVFEPVMTHPAGKGATVEYKFRNGDKVSFEAYSIDVKKLLNDVKAYIKRKPARLNWEKINLNNIGYRLVEKNETRYIGAKAASWNLDLKPDAMHFDRRITVTTPLQKAGAYLLTAKMSGGNTARIVIWVTDTVIVKKQLNGEVYYFVADAVTGTPAAGANVEFFGYRQKHIKNTQNYMISTKNFAEFTDNDGQVIPDPKDMPKNYSWLVIAATKSGRFAYMGFRNVWYGSYRGQEYNSRKVFTITDRPVYRPGQKVKFKFWVRNAVYDRKDTSDFAGQRFTVRITNPKGEKVYEKNFTAGAYGGFDSEFALPEDAALGVYRMFLPKVGGSGYFRVEEYKKPEFEVTVEAPKEPVMLGDKIKASISAKYYFGAPVTKAKVRYKVLRTDYTADWYPAGIWDWFYGRGYWWYAYNYVWYPGWNEWGCMRPRHWWIGYSHNPPELVMENEVEIGKDGKVNVEIDTSFAKELHGDIDHKYEITAEVVDESRRTVTGKGSVIAARKPFKVYAWVDRGYYRIGDVIHADFSAFTPDNKPVQGKGKLQLLRITCNRDGKPVETLVRKWNLDTDEEGKAGIQMKASRAGQYRISYELTDKKKQTIEGGYIFCVVGSGSDTSGFRFNDIELTNDRREYKPGDTVKLLINTNRIGSTVVLFLRPANAVYLKPKIIRMKGKSVIEEIPVLRKDMPNFFVEAFTISNGKIYSETKEIIVPPEKRVLNVKVIPSSAIYKPGEKAKVIVKLTDFFGKPFAGSTVISIYDKAVEYISGGSNVPDIKSFFWKWRRRHRTLTESSLQKYFRNLLRPGEKTMQNIGVFGHAAVNDRIEESGQEGERWGKGGISGAHNSMSRKMLSMSESPGAVMKSEMKDKSAGEKEQETAVQPVIRKEFADTAFWAASVTTDRDGYASVNLRMPENLTGWKVKVWAMGHGTKVGEGTAEVVTAKNLMLRMQAPRFFVQTDEVVLSANVHNYLKTAKSVKVVLELEGKCLKPMGKLTKTVNIKAGGEERVDWRVKAVEEGEAVIRMFALTDEESDAMEMKFPVYVHGMMKMVSFSGALRPEQKRASFTISVPKQRRINDSRLELRYSPTLAGAMVDALPYLVEYPYGCTEQTLNRFLPTVITWKILKDMGLDLKEIRKIRTNLNAQEIGDDRERAGGWKRWKPNPVFDDKTVMDMVKKGVRQLTVMQLSDGGWGWFSGWGERSYPHTTALVVHGLQIGRENGIAIVPGVIKRGVQWLKNYQAEQVRRIKNAPAKIKPWKENADNIDAFVYMVLTDADFINNDMCEFLYRGRNSISVYAKAMYGIALHKQGKKEKLAMIMKNIEQYLVQDDENQTAYLDLPNSGYWWYWYGSEYEADAYYLKLLSRTNPKDEKASRLVKYLLNNRKHAAYWNSTRDTAICIEAMADYLRASGEDKPDMSVEIYIDGKKQKEVKINAENLFTFDNKFVLTGDAVETGKHRIEIKKKGKGPLYFNAYLSYFTLEDFITRAGLEVRVNRKYYKLVKADKKIKAAGARGQVVDQKVEKFKRLELPNLSELKSGDIVEIELEIDSKNDYEYLVFEDMKAAGFEPVEVRSGYTSRDLGAYMELRDEKVCFFIRALPRGKHSVSYRMRAEIPGKFSALPARGYAMYAPELKGNSDEIKLIIE